MHCRPSHRLRRRRYAAGFTLIELMIAIVVLAILAGVAYPSFMDSIRKGRRSEAFAALSAIQQGQERWRGNNSTFTTTLSDINVSANTPSGYYALSISAPDAPATTATGYVAVAEGKAGTSQANDAQCRKLGVRVLGGNITYGGCTGCGSLTFAATHPCWSR